VEMLMSDIRIKISLIVVLYLVTVMTASCQLTPDSVRAHKITVRRFYDFLLTKKMVSMKDCIKLFGPLAMEGESYLFSQDCNQKKGVEKCNRLWNERYASWSSYQSLLFIEFKKERIDLTQNYELDKILAVIDKMKVRSLGAVVLDFSGKKIIFTFSNPKYDEFYITDIFLDDGSSIYNYVKGGGEKHFYK